MADFVDAQPPLLAVLLLVAGVAKLMPFVRGRVSVANGVVALVPEPLRPKVSFALAIGEAGLGLALVVSGDFVVRAAAVAMFGTATAVVGYLWRRRPEAGCGCFGAVSSSPVGVRTVARTAVLAGMAVVGLAGRDSAAEVVSRPSGWLLAILVVEIAVLAALSPELDSVVRRLRGQPGVPCAYRWVPVSDTVRKLHRSAAWASHVRTLTTVEPVDVWRDLCWRIFSYPGQHLDRAVQVVFAVHLDGRHPEIGVAVVDAEREEVLVGSGAAAQLG